MKLGKFAALLVIVALIVSSLTMVNASVEEDIAKPSVPEFSVSIVTHPYNVPEKTTTTIDQYTGKETTTTILGYLVENKSIEVKIQNQPFTPFTLNSHQGCRYDTDIDQIVTFTVNESITVNNYFVVLVRGHFGDEDDWKNAGSVYTIQSDSENTIVTVKLDNYPSDAVLDFKVQAATGYLFSFYVNIQLPLEKFFGVKSDWSNIQVLTLGEAGTAASLDQPTSTSSPTTTTSPTLTPTQQIEQTEMDSGFNWETTAIAIISITVTILVAAMLILAKRNHKKS